MSLELQRRIEARRRVYLLRHGEVSYFDPAGKPYRPDGVPLNAQGVAQAEAARDVLRKIPIDRAIHTGLPRTKETAEIVLQGQEVQLETCEALREVSPGPMDASGAGSMEERFVGALSNVVSRESRFLGGESFGSLEDRVLPALRELLAAPGWKHLLIVAHGGTNRVILLHALGASIEHLGRLEQEAGCINVIDVEESQQMLVRQVNYTPYSPLKENIWSTTMEKIYLDHYASVDSRLRPKEDR